MDRDRLLFLADEEARLRQRVTSLINIKKRLISVIGDEDICQMLIDTVTALNKATSEYDAVYNELQMIIQTGGNNERNS